MILLNAGTIAILVYLIVLILIVSGWKEVFMKSLSYRACLLFMLGWLICVFMNLQITPNIRLNAGIVVLLSSALLCFFQIQVWYRKLYVLTVTVLIGTVYALFGHFVRMDPIFIWVSPVWDPVIVATLCVLLAVQSIEEQMVVITIAFLLGDGLLQWISGGHHVISLGTAGWYDQWWLAIVVARLSAWCWESAMIVGKQTAGFVYRRVKSWKK
ncbi:hypothetical protein BVG16_03695 [Paenibacillus selenitireducens]|uniref:Uncharacterized protein n=1 Tax=Paenibacillus selenitireducens TaxID=1324314 RepID=A0A1T2XNH1_9BACL|nr:hypothetical protein [Paenibacillus selenitireducens]OPA81424.1 hypothetical protein BVG16_03695 [Paenibacillus selenitireducens]